MFSHLKLSGVFEISSKTAIAALTDLNTDDLQQALYMLFLLARSLNFLITGVGVQVMTENCNKRTSTWREVT